MFDETKNKFNQRKAWATSVEAKETQAHFLCLAHITSAQDQDNDGVLNAVEYVLRGNVLTNDFSKLPVLSSSGRNILFTFQRTQTSINSTTALRIQVGTTLLAWPDNYTVGADTTTSSAGVTVLKGVPAGFDTVTLSVPEAPDLQKFIRLNVNITP